MCVCVSLCLCETDNQTALGDAPVFSTLLFLSLSLPFLPPLIYFYLPVHQPSPPCVHLIYHPFLLTSTSPLHLRHSSPLSQKPIASLSLDLSFLFEHFLLHLLFCFHEMTLFQQEVEINSVQFKFIYANGYRQGL